jgi:phosphoenolpyruvate mutase
MTLRHLISPEERRKKLKEALETKNIVRGIEAHNALSALISNDLKVTIQINNSGKVNEFDFFWESSLTDSASKGHPDIEVISFDSRIKTITEILEVTDKPMIVDGDTGGDIHHFEYLIPKLESIGVSAIIIEDKVFPKRNSLEAGVSQEQEDPEKFARKIKAGKMIQKSKDFMIIARIKSLIAGKDLEDAFFRARKYLEAGVDGIMIHSKSEDSSQMIEFAKEYKKILNELNLKKPLVSVPTTYNSIRERELQEAGFNIVIYANHMLRASYRAMENVGKIILENERSLEADPYIASVKEIFEKVGFLDIKEKDKLLSTTPSVIIPAAGVNPEFGEIPGDLPKPLIKINEKRILEHQISLLKKLGLSDVNVIIGYQKHLFNGQEAEYIENPDYSSTGVIHSIMKARHKMKNGFISINSDLLLDERLLKEILKRREDIVIVVDNSYLYHKHEVDKVLDGVITKRGTRPSYQRLRGSDDEVLLIGKKIPKEKMTHEFIGITKFSEKGARDLIKIYEECKQNHQGSFHEAESFEKATNTDMIQEMVNRGFKIAIHETNGGWLEIHNKKDLELAGEILSRFNE